MDKKIFFLFENTKNPGISVASTKKGRKKKKKYTSSAASTPSDNKKNTKQSYSLNDLLKLNTEEINRKIFTFSKRLTSDDLTKMQNEVKKEKELSKIIMNLECMRGIDEESIPTFLFF